MIRDRIFEVIYHKLSKYGAVKKIADESEISLSAWQTAAAKKQRANEEMIEFVCRKWPEFAVYIATGENPVGSDITQTTPEQEKIREMRGHHKLVLKKEPIDWSAEEKSYMKNHFDPIMNYEFMTSDQGFAELIALQASTDKELLKTTTRKIEAAIERLDPTDAIKIYGIGIEIHEYWRGKDVLQELGHKI